MRLMLVLLAAAASKSHASPGHRQQGRQQQQQRQPRRPSALRDYGNTEIWPLPASAVPAGCCATLDAAAFSIIVAQPQNDPYLTEVAARFMPQILHYPNATLRPGCASVANLTLSVLDGSVRQIQQDVNETYNLTFAADCSSAAVVASTIFGARHALETFAQQVAVQRPVGQYSIDALNVVEGPRFSFRGLLIDSSRHWLPPNLLLNVLDALSMHKQNAVLWGVGIATAWVVQSAAFPALTNTSFGPAGTHVYSREAVAFLSREANYRGVRLIPYVDTLSGAISMPALQYCNGVAGAPGGLFHPLHAATWAFFDTLWADLKAVFPENYVQLGGDGLNATAAACWGGDPEVAAWNKGHGYPANDTEHVSALFLSKMMASAAKAGFSPMWYADAFAPLNATGVSLAGTGVVFNGWDVGTPGSLARVIAAPGARAIVTSFCFLAPGQECPGFPQCGGDEPNWWYNYGCEIQNHSHFPAAAWPFLHNIIGGGVSRWGQATDATNFFQFVYPAIMGSAEKLWSPAALTNGSYYGTRQEVFADHRCVLVRRGVPVQPTSAYSWSCDFEWEPAYPPRTPLNPNPTNSSWGAAEVGPALQASTVETAKRTEAAAPSFLTNAAVPADGRAAVAGGGVAASAPRRTAASAGGSAAAVDDEVSIWPYPAQHAAAACPPGGVGLDPKSFAIVLAGALATDPWMIEVTRRFRDAILWHPAGRLGAPTALKTLTITVTNPSVRQIQQNVNESYSLSFAAGTCTSATISAATIFGARHGLETFSQHVRADRLTGDYVLAAYNDALNIEDTPRFTFRGLMVDSARHWLPPNLLLSIMDALSYHKLNVLMVGFGIDWSWTVVSNAFPNLTDSSYSPAHRFSRETVAFLVQEANYRGIRLMPYFEVVGHDALCAAVPDVCYCGGKPGGNLPHPLHAETWAFFAALWADLKLIFPETYINIGGDEVDTSCWKGDPEIDAWNAARGYPAGDTDHIAGYYYQQQALLLVKHGFKAMLYAEAFGALNATGFNAWGTVLFNAWDPSTPGSTAPLIAAGAQVIVTSYCFLAPTQGCPDNLPDGSTPDVWTNRACEIQNASLFPASALPFLHNIVGGAPARWGEQTDGTNLYQFTWPALSGAAEVLWSPFNVTSNASLSRQSGYEATRCMLVRRGVPMDPRDGPAACDYEWEPPYPPLTLLNPNPANSSWANSSWL